MFLRLYATSKSTASSFVILISTFYFCASILQQMKIVILDGHTLNPGDLSWEDIEALGQVDIYERTSYQEIVERASRAEVVLINKSVMDESNLSQLPRLKFIGVTATGYNTIDLEACHKQNITVSNVPGYGSTSVSQHTFALILSLTNHVEQHHNHVVSGGWANSPDWSYGITPLMELKDKTMGIVGLGQIGQKVAQIALGFEMKVLANSRTQKNIMQKIPMVELDTIFKESDIVSLHCPLTPENEGMINKDRLQTMKRSAFLINTARGQLVNEVDLADAISEGTIAGAGLDVLSQEPPPSDHPLIGIPSCLVTPHHAWATRESRLRLMEILVKNVNAYLKGNPINVVG